MKNIISKILPSNKKDVYAYMLLAVLAMPFLCILFGGNFDYMLANVVCLIIYCIIFIFIFIKALQTKSLKNYFKSAAFLLLTLLFAWIVLSNFFAYDKNGSWLGVIDGKHQEVSVFQYIFYFTVAICAINLKKENINYILNSTILFAVFVIIVQFGLKDYSFGFIHKNHTGYFLTLSLMLSVGKFFFAKGFVEGFLMLGSSILHFASLVANGSMGPIVAIITFFVLGMIYVLIHHRKLFVRLLSVFACFLVVVCVFDFVPKVKDLRDEEATTVEKVVDIAAVALNKLGLVDDERVLDENLSSGSDGYGRFMMWQRALDNMIEFPLFGVGNAWQSYNQDMPNPKPHNEFLQYGAMCGVPALLFYVSLMIYLLAKFRKTHKKTSETTFVLITAIFVYLVQSIFGNAMPFVSPLFFLIVGLAIKCLDFEKFEEKNS